MEKRRLEKAIALMVTATMSVGMLSGCGKKEKAENTGANQAAEDTTKAEATAEPTKSEDAANTTETAEATEAPAVAGMEGWEAFPEKVTLQIPVYDRGVQGVPDVSNNYWTQWVQQNFGDKYNITVEYVPIPRNDVMTNYAMLGAAGDLPTVLMEYDYPKQAQWAADGYLAEYDINEFAKVAPTYYQKMSDLGILDYTVMDGKCYFALAERPYSFSNFQFTTFVRMDWLKKVGYDHVPATRAEYLDAMKKIMDAGLSEHPGGGSMITGVGSDQNYGYRQVPTNEEEWVMYGDYNIPSLGWEPNRKLLKYANEEFNLGITNPEYFVTDAETDKANFVNGETYRYGSYISANMDWLVSFYAANPDAELAIQMQSLEPDTAEGTVPAYRANNPFGMMVGFSSQASEDEIKAAWMYMEWLSQKDNLFTMQWGVEGENFNYDSNGLPVSVGDYNGEYLQGFGNNKDYCGIVVEGRIAGTTEDFIKSLVPQGLPQDFTQDIIQNYQNSVEADKKGWALVDCMFGTEIKSQSEYQQTLVELYKEYRDKLTMCKPEEFDALYDDLAQKYMDAGYKEVTDERLQAFKDGKTSKMQ